MQRENYRPPVRFGAWGNQGLTFWVRANGAARRVAGLLFEVGPCGPYAGQVGSPLRQRYLEVLRAWVQTGELPEEAVYH